MSSLISQNVDAILNRFKMAMSLQTDAEIASILGKSRNSVPMWRARRSIPIEEMIDASQNVNISIDWLLTGHGAMYAHAGLSELPVLSQTRGDEEAFAGAVRIPIYEQGVSAGTGTEPKGDMILGSGTFLVEWVRALGISPSHAFLVPVDGDSMEPTIRDGELILCESTREYSRSGIYVFRYEGEIMVKRLMRQQGTLIAISENPRIPPFSIDPNQNDFAIVGRVGGRFGKVG